MKNGEEQSNTVKKIINSTNVKTESLNTLSNLTEEERGQNKDYLSIMKENIEKLRKELYK